MARLRDLPAAIRRIGFLRFLKNVWGEVVSDNVFTYAAALAYSWLFAIFPFFIFLMSLLPYLPDNWKPTETQLKGMLDEQLPKAAHTVSAEVVKFLNEPKGGLLSVGLLVAIWAASGGMAMTMAAMDSAYDAKSRPFYKQRPAAIGLTIVIATLLLCVMVLVPVGTLLEKLARTYGDKWLAYVGLDAYLLPTFIFTWGIVRFSLALLLLLLALAILHKFGTAAKTRFQLFSPGAVFTIVVWFLLGTAFRLYVDKFGKYEKTYGAVGGVAVLLLFFYIDALVLLIGAEINAEINREVNPDRAPDRDPEEDEPVPVT